MQVFCDESYSTRASTGKHHSTLSGVAIPLANLRTISRELFNLKKQYFNVTDIGQFEIKGNLLLGRNKFKKTDETLSEKYFGFVRSVLTTCKKYNIRLFAITIQYDDDNNGIHCKSHDGMPKLSPHYQFLLERVNQHVLESPYKTVATLVFDQISRGSDKVRSAAFTNFMFKTRSGQRFADNVSIIPYFVDSSVSEGAQIADLVAYIVNAYNEGRNELREFYELVHELQFRSMNKNIRGIRYKRKRERRP